MNKKVYTPPKMKFVRTYLEQAILQTSLEFHGEEEADVWSVHGDDDFQVDEDYDEYDE